MWVDLLPVFYEEIEGQKVKETCQDHPAGKWQSQDSNSQSLAPKPLLWTPISRPLALTIMIEEIGNKEL